MNWNAEIWTGIQTYEQEYKHMNRNAKIWTGLLTFLRTNVSTLRAVIVSEEELEKKWNLQYEMGFADFVHCPASSSLFRWLCRDILIFPFSVPFFSFCFFLNYWLSSYFFLYFFAFLLISLHSCSYLCIPVHIFALLFISLHSCSYPCIPVHITSIYASFTSTFSYLLDRKSVV